MARRDLLLWQKRRTATVAAPSKVFVADTPALWNAGI
jgi:hypothetical protein